MPSRWSLIRTHVIPGLALCARPHARGAMRSDDLRPPISHLYTTELSAWARFRFQQPEQPQYFFPVKLVFVYAAAPDHGGSFPVGIRRRRGSLFYVLGSAKSLNRALFSYLCVYIDIVHLPPLLCTLLCILRGVRCENRLDCLKFCLHKCPLQVFQSSPSSQSVRTRNRGTAVPLVNWEESK